MAVVKHYRLFVVKHNRWLWWWNTADGCGGTLQMGVVKHWQTAVVEHYRLLW